MGTRGLMGVHVDGETKVAYNHFDSYPEGLGQDIVDTILDHDRSYLAELARKLRAVDTSVAPTEDERLELVAFYDPNVGGPADTKDPEILWYQYLRKAQGDLLAMLRSGRFDDGRSFANDSLFCEWAYVVNFDEGVLEVYRGSQTSPHTNGRFSDWGDAELHTSREWSMRDATGKITNYPATTYYPIRLIEAIPLDELVNVEMTAERFDPEQVEA